MQPLVSTIKRARKALIAVTKFLLQGKKMLVRAILAALWLTPSDGSPKSPKFNTSSTKSRKGQKRGKTTIETFLKEAEALLLDPVDGRDSLVQFANQLKTQFRDRMLSSPACMLPSYNSQLPTGFECGQYLSLDVGGSTLRVALVELQGRKEDDGNDGPVSSRIVRMRSYHIGPDIKALEGLAFFDWMAEQILATIEDGMPRDGCLDTPLLMGLAWSFPLQQVSLKGGLLQPMGKGFLAANGLIGQDLGDIISLSCRKIGLLVELRAIINDSSAALLSQAYLAPSATRFGLILGTGVNVAVHMPCSYIGQPKFGNRPQEWFDAASHVIVNTELGMFGQDILPVTRWDEQLNRNHPKPEFQPLEHLVSGMYLGEVVRIVLIEAIETTGLLGGVVPSGIEKGYGLDTATLSVIEGDSSPTFESAVAHFNDMHPSSSPASAADIAAIRSIASYVSRRSAAIVAASLYALWDLRKEAEASTITTPQLPAKGSQLPSPPPSSPILPPNRVNSDRVVVAFNGSVIENYPDYLENCQAYLDLLVEDEVTDSSSMTGGSIIDLVEARDSSLLGAAVALASAV